MFPRLGSEVTNIISLFFLKLHCIRVHFKIWPWQDFGKTQHDRQWTLGNRMPLAFYLKSKIVSGSSRGKQNKEGEMQTKGGGKEANGG